MHPLGACREGVLQLLLILPVAGVLPDGLVQELISLLLSTCCML